jgi:hypothetical protein
VTTRERLTVAERALERRAENVEILMGFLGFFTALLLISTIIAELKGEPSLARALTLAVLVGLFLVLLHIRNALRHQLAARMGRGGRGGRGGRRPA